MNPETKKSVIAFIEDCDYFKGKQIFKVLENDTFEILEQYAEIFFRKTVIRFEAKT